MPRIVITRMLSVQTILVLALIGSLITIFTGGVGVIVGVGDTVCVGIGVIVGVAVGEGI